MSHVVGKIGYVGPMIAHPVSATILPEKRSNLNWDWKDVPIGDGDAIPGGATLASHGFACLPHESSIAEFDDGLAWGPHYREEVTDFITRMTGATDVTVLGSRLGDARLGGARGTVDFCHNDFTAASVGGHVHDLDPERAEERLSRRFAIYNVWRLVSPPPQSKPLAVCDATSVAIADLVPGQTHWGPPDEEVYRQNALFRYNPAHRWYFYPKLERDRVLIWAGFDSDPAFPSIVPHAAFVNPDCTDPSARRISVDCRAYVFFDS